MLRSEKDKVIGGIKGQLATASAIFLVDFTGINVEAVSKLRRQVRRGGGLFKVGKNTFVSRACNELNLEALIPELVGQTAIITVPDDPVPVAKVLYDFIKGGGKITPKRIFVDKTFMAPDQLEMLSKLPTRMELLGQIAGLIEAPMVNFVGLLESLMCEFPRSVDALTDKRGGSAPVEEKAAPEAPAEVPAEAAVEAPAEAAAVAAAVEAPAEVPAEAAPVAAAVEAPAEVPAEVPAEAVAETPVEEAPAPPATETTES